MTQKTRLPIPKNITRNHPDYPYWTALSTILTQDLLNGVLSKSEVGYIYKKFASHKGNKREYVKKINSELDKIRFQIDTALRNQDEIELQEKIEAYVNQFPTEMHDSVYTFITTFEIPYPTFFDDLREQYNHLRSNSEISYESLNPYAAAQDLKTDILRLDSKTKQAFARNSQPLPQKELEELLNSTQKIGSTISTPHVPQNNVEQLQQFARTNVADIPKPHTNTKKSLTDSFLSPQNKL